MKNTILSFLIAGAIGGGVLLGADIQVLEMKDGNRYLTGNQYSELKMELKTKYENDEIYSYQEYETFVAVLNHEAKQDKYQKLSNKEKGDIIMLLVKELEYENK